MCYHLTQLDYKKIGELAWDASCQWTPTPCISSWDHQADAFFATLPRPAILSASLNAQDRGHIRGSFAHSQPSHNVPNAH